MRVNHVGTRESGELRAGPLCVETKCYSSVGIACMQNVSATRSAALCSTGGKRCTHAHSVCFTRNTS